MLKNFFMILAFGLFALDFVRSDAIDCSKRLPNLNIRECCAEPKIDRKPVLSSCAKQVNLQPSDNGAGFSCFAECFYNTTKIRVNGDFDLSKIRTIVDADFSSEKDFGTVITKSFETCIPIAKSKAAMNNQQLGPNQCNPVSRYLMECTQMQNFINCPATKWKSTPDCIKSKEYATKCT